ncbi:putative E3 ubiquitin-protein ligase BAH1-like 1 isoform X1 [Canna indica]|uniref:RING-type E3 ubiquitin transferase n=1 Tax=Canna indica TaxID=4628 RepID=A0AAQ3K1V5_9LILI|nr:putative E3 ubiquitin-protein ligase BAH1-like 1 isoform X1 [Canna indica]
MYPNKFPNVDYKGLKKILRRCKNKKLLHANKEKELSAQKDNGASTNKQHKVHTIELPEPGLDDSASTSEQHKESTIKLSEPSQSECCVLCDEEFFAELSNKAEVISICFNTKVRPDNLRASSGLLRCMWRFRNCITDDQQVPVHEVRILADYIAMNSIAIKKILKKYDKIHGSAEGQNFKMRMRTRNIDLLQPPWIIELGAFYINSNASEYGQPGKHFPDFSCELFDEDPKLIMTISDSFEDEYSLTCSICWEILYNAYALECGHLFCKECVCSYASISTIEGPTRAPDGKECPYCRTAGVFKNAVSLKHLDLLVKTRFYNYCDIRVDRLLLLICEIAEMCIWALLSQIGLSDV